MTRRTMHTASDHAILSKPFRASLNMMPGIGVQWRFVRAHDLILRDLQEERNVT